METNPTDDPAEEGWFTDPYGRHEARWLSAGHPTKLVRDKGVEAHDEPPDTPPTQTPVRLEEDPESRGGADLRRADDAEREDNTRDSSQAYMQQMDTVWSDGTPMTILYKDS